MNPSDRNHSALPRSTERASGNASDLPMAYVDGVFQPEVYALALAAEAFGKAIQARFRCGAGPLECGGVCCRLAGHEPPCLCAGDTDGPGTCPA